MGERARSKGINGENKAWEFLRALGYQIYELNNEKYNIDCLARFPKKTVGGELHKPCYSPDGLAAFEITTEERLRKEKVIDFEAKITRYNTDNLDEKIGGGVLLIDQKIPQSMIELMESKHIFGWGPDRQSLYSERIRLFKDWKKQFYVFHICEILLDKTTTYFRCSTPPPTESKELFHYAIFCDDLSRRIQARNVMQIMEKIKETLSPIVKLGIAPFNVHLEFHVLGGISVKVEDVLKGIADSWENDGISVDLSQDSFKDYQTFPALQPHHFENQSSSKL